MSGHACMAQMVAASGNSASESSWETASGGSSPAHSTGGSQLARLPATPERGDAQTPATGQDMAAGASRNIPRGKATVVAVKRKADAGAAEVQVCCLPGIVCRP